jgi:hypothetical protein
VLSPNGINSESKLTSSGGGVLAIRIPRGIAIEKIYFSITIMQPCFKIWHSWQMFCRTGLNVERRQYLTHFPPLQDYSSTKAFSGGGIGTN